MKYFFWLILFLFFGKYKIDILIEIIGLFVCLFRYSNFNLLS